MAEALYPGEPNRLLKNAGGFICTVLKRYGSRPIARLGYDTAYTEAMYGALRGIVAWLLKDGPARPELCKIQTFIIRGIVYHFGHAFPWAVGPIRLNRIMYKADPDSVLKLRELTDDDRDEGFEYTDKRFDEIADDESFQRIGAAILDAADRADPDGKYYFRVTIDLRHGITSGIPLTFEEIAERSGVRRQAIFQRYKRAIETVRKVLAASGVDGPTDLG